MDYSEGIFTKTDYCICALMLIFSATIGIYYRFSGGRQRTNNEYFLGNKDMPILPVAFSLMASFMSAITILGVASENYMNGTQFAIINIAYIIGTPIAAFIFLPVFFQMQATSAFEYLERRFSKAARLLASSIFILQMVLYMSIVLYTPALTLSAVTGLSRWISVFSVGIVCTFYCTIGGIKAVLWTDLFQSLLMFFAVFAVIIKGTMDVGGFSQVWELAEKGQRIQFFNFNPDPTVRHTVWTLAVGGIFTYVCIYAVNQAQVQRLLTVKSLKKSQIAMFLNWPITSLLSLTTCFAGLVVYANLANCDPILNPNVKNVQKSDQVLPYFVMVSLSEFPGLPGLFVAGVFSAALSTVSSAINSLAAVTVEDFLLPFCFRHTSETRIALYTKFIAFSYGVLCMLLTFIVEKLEGILQASLTIFNVIGGPMLGFYSLGMLFRRANAKGSIIGFLVSVCLCLWIGFGAMMRTKVASHDPYRSTDGCYSNFSLVDNNNTFTYDTSPASWTNPLQSTTLLDSNYTFTYDPSPENWTTPLQNTTLAQDEVETYTFPLLKISYMWYAGLGWITCILVGLGASMICGKQEYVNPVLLSPLVTIRRSEKGPMSEVVQMAECT